MTAKPTRDPTRLREALRRAPKPFEERLARAYEEEIDPLWGARFCQLMLGALPETISGAVLEVGCGTGLLTAELVRRHQAGQGNGEGAVAGGGKNKGRVVALEFVPALLEHARERCREVRPGGDGPGLFFRPQEEGERLPFAEETFDLVVAGPSLGAPPLTSGALAELVRVANPGAQVLIATPLAGTWQEPLDLFGEVLRQLQRGPARAALEEHRARMPEGAALAEMMEQAGLQDVEVETTRWQLLFRSGREFFYAPLVEGGPLPDWRLIAQENGPDADPDQKDGERADSAGDDGHEIFVAWKEAIDTYFAHQAFAVSVLAGRASGRKPAARPAEAPEEAPETPRP
jgi:ubiquinone/menaquinone biosynthesis C-methylase UbiE